MWKIAHLQKEHTEQYTVHMGISRKIHRGNISSEICWDFFILRKSEYAGYLVFYL